MNTNFNAPWAIGLETDEEQAQIINAEGERICYVQIDPVEATARLISSAPDLYNALQDLFAQCEMVHKYWGEEGNQREADAAIAAARAALAKVGES